jgi:hypothetical protein
MSAQTSALSSTTRSHRGALTAGLILIGIGLFSILENFFQMEFAVLPLLGVIFLAAGLLTRRTGLLVPGGILSGLGAATWLTESQLISIAEPARAGIILLGLAMGFTLISLLSTYTEGLTRFKRWPLIPAAALAFFGLALLASIFGLPVEAFLQIAFPAALMVIGLGLIVFRK